VNSHIALQSDDARILTTFFTPTGSRLATVSLDGTIRFWDLTSEQPTLLPLVLTRKGGEIRSAAICPDGRWLCVGGSREGTTHLWDLMAPDPPATSMVLRGHDSPVSSIKFAPDARWLITSSRQRTLSGIRYTSHLWSLKSGMPEGPPTILQGTADGSQNEFAEEDFLEFSPNGRWVVTGGGLMLLLWDLDFDSLLSRARNRAGRTLSIEKRQRYQLTD